MGYDISRILTGQLFFLVGSLFSIGVIILLEPFRSPVIQYFFTFNQNWSSILPHLLIQLALIQWVLIGVNIMASLGVIILFSGIVRGVADNPFDLFGIGLIMLVGGIGFFSLAGIIQWSPFVNALWAGSETKPEATFVSIYASVQVITSSIIIIKSLPSIFQEMIKLSKIQ